MTSIQSDRLWVAQNEPSEVSGAKRLATLQAHLQGEYLMSVLPFTWHLDFPYLPAHLFQSCQSDPLRPLRPVPIQSLLGTASEFRGRVAFARLLSLGQWVRDRILTYSHVSSYHAVASSTSRDACHAVALESLITHEVKMFWKWALRDAGLHTRKQYSLAFCCARPTRTPTIPDSSTGEPDYSDRPGAHRFHEPRQADYDAASTRLETKMHQLLAHHQTTPTNDDDDAVVESCGAGLHRDKSPPDSSLCSCSCSCSSSYTIFGIAACGTCVALVALPSHSRDTETHESRELCNIVETGAMQSLGVLDYSDPNQDLQTTLAICLVLMAAREEVMVHRRRGDEAARRKPSRETLLGQFECMELLDLASSDDDA